MTRLTLGIFFFLVGGFVEVLRFERPGSSQGPPASESEPAPAPAAEPPSEPASEPGPEGDVEPPRPAPPEPQDAILGQGAPAPPAAEERAIEAAAEQHPVPDVVAGSMPRARIALLLDGPWQRDRHALDQLRNRVLIAAAPHGARFPAELARDGGWTRSGVEDALEELLLEESADLIIAYGPLASNAALRHAELSKPVIAPVVLAPYYQRAPLHEGSSGRENLSYLGTPRDFARDLETLHALAPFERIGFLLPQSLAEAVPSLLPAFTAAARQLGVGSAFQPLGASAAATLAALDADLDAVYVGPLAELADAELEALFDGFAARGLASFSFWGSGDVERGLLIGKRGEQQCDELFESIADQVVAILAGEPASELPVLFDGGERLVLNMRTARALGVRPDWSVLTGTDLLHEQPEVDPRQWTLSQVMRWAGLANRDVLTSLNRVEAGEQRIYGARSELYPRVTVAARGVVLNDDGAAFRAQRQLLGFLRVRQVLYDERLLADYEIEKWLQDSRSFEHEALVLDVQFLAAQAYLELLRAKTFVRVRQRDLALSSANLELVGLRRRNGPRSEADHYRWQNRIALGRRGVLEAQARQRQAELELNRLLHRPLGEDIETVEAGVDDPGVLMAGAQLQSYLENPWSFDTLAEFVVQEGLANAPELRAIEASISAADRDVEAGRRAFWMPRLTLDGDVIERFGFARNTPVDRDDDTVWSVAVNASFDLYRGGARPAALQRSRHELLALRSLHSATSERVEQSVRSRMAMVTASYPGIDLASDAVWAARQNLTLVRELYTAGDASVVAMLDAQDAALESEEMSANAAYEFLLDLMSVQRAAGRYDYFMSPGEREEWFQRLDRFARVQQ